MILSNIAILDAIERGALKIEHLAGRDPSVKTSSLQESISVSASVREWGTGASPVMGSAK
jgi:hypothetical protein